MSSYTTQLRYICESLAGERKSVDYSKIDDVVDAARVKIFDFDYPLPATSKEVFERNFIMHFYAREIGFETYGYWKLKLRSRLNLICPRYAKLLKSENLIDDPFNSFDKTTTRNGENNTNEDAQNTRAIVGGWSDCGSTDIQNSSTTSETENDTTKDYADYTDHDKTKKGDTPQGGATAFSNTYQSEWGENEHIVKRENPSDSIKNGSESKINRESGVDSESHQNVENSREYQNYSENTENNVGRYEQITDETHESGYSGINKSQYLEDYRKTFINIILQLINELDDLFMQLW